MTTQTFKKGDKVKITNYGWNYRFTSHPDLAKELKVHKDHPIYYKAPKPNHDVLIFERFISFNNCPKVMLCSCIFNATLYYYAFGYDEEYKIKSYINLSQNQNRKIVGYKLLKDLPNQKSGIIFYNNPLEEMWHADIDSGSSYDFHQTEIDNAPDWFEPIYEVEEKEVSLNCDKGKFIAKVIPGESIKYNDEKFNASRLKELIKYTMECINGYDVKKETISIGCMRNILISDIQNVLDIYNS